jgi:hypothetical protein
MANDEKAPATTDEQTAVAEPQATTTSTQPVTVILQQPNLAAEGARAMAEGRALNMDETVPGGKYRVGNKLVDANGEPFKARGKDKAEDEDEDA